MSPTTLVIVSEDMIKKFNTVKHLLDRVHDYRDMVSSLIQDLVTYQVRYHPETGLFFDFMVTDNETPRNLQVLFWAPGNYIGIFTRFQEIRDFQSVLLKRDFTLGVYHDSCWRDSLDRILKEHDRINFDTITSYKVINIPEDMGVYLRSLIRTRSKTTE